MTGSARVRALGRSRPARFVLWRLRSVHSRVWIFFAAVAYGYSYFAVEETSAGNWGPLALWVLGVALFLLWFTWPAIASRSKRRTSTSAHRYPRLWS